MSEHIETLEEIDVEYKELAVKSGIKEWRRVPALGCEPTFISDLADAVIESLPYVGAMAVSNLEARQVPIESPTNLEPWSQNLNARNYLSFIISNNTGACALLLFIFKYKTILFISN